MQAVKGGLLEDHRRRLARKMAAEGKTFHKLSWNEKVMVEHKKVNQ